MEPSLNELKVQHLAKHFKSRTVVHDVSILLRSGEVVGLLGPNGAGKTTSFYMIVGLIAADTGEIFLNEIDITDLPMHSRARLGLSYLPQEHSIFRKLTVNENIHAVLELNPELDASAREAREEELLQQFNLTHLRHEPAYRLSGGEQRRVEIARAIANLPKFILLDEPFAGIDPISIQETKKLIQQLAKQGIGVLISDHNVRETLDICQRAYIVSEGRILAAGAPDDIINDTLVKEAYLGTA